ncbi:MAG: hypothetical protein IJU39_01125 [Clostridia bacterium]|nr:hypothetical protein [Clostridia bacterium]
MSITPTELTIIGKNEDYLGKGLFESEGDYISRKRRADLICVVQKVLDEELSEEERTILLAMAVEKKSASSLCKELNTNLSRIYRARDRAEKRVAEILKYVLYYRNTFENRAITPIELKNLVTLAGNRALDRNSIVHRLRTLMARECIAIETLYRTPGFTKKSVDEIFASSRLPDVKEIIAFSNFFGTSADYLLKGETICQNN